MLLVIPGVVVLTLFINTTRIR